MAEGSGEGRARALAWVRARPAAVPPELSAAVRAALERLGPGPAGEGAADALARAATGELDAVLARGEEGRAAALPLLAADACLAYAFEAAAESGADLGGLAAGLGPRGALGDRLALALEEARRGSGRGPDAAPADRGRGRAP